MIGRIFGTGLGVLGCVLIATVPILQLAVNLWVVVEATNGNFLAFIVAFFFFPVTIIAAPWYALIAWGNPWPLIITYGGFLFLGLGRIFGGRD